MIGDPEVQNLPESIASGYFVLPVRLHSDLYQMSIRYYGSAGWPVPRGKHLDQHSMPKSLKQVIAAYQLIGCDCHWEQPAGLMLRQWLK